MFKLTNKNIIITGAGSGIGEALAKTIAKQGAIVHLLDYKVKTVARVAEAINHSGGTAHFYECDITDEERVGHVFVEIVKSGVIDVLINNAGIAHIGNIEKTSSKDLDRLYEVNIKGLFICTKAAIANMKGDKNGGLILNMASIASSVGIADRFAYSMSKGAVKTMTYSIAKDYLESHIRCNSISPARVHTPFVDGFIKQNYPERQAEMFEKLAHSQPIGRMGKPEEVAALAVYLCSDEASFLTGTDFPIDGGFIKLNG